MTVKLGELLINEGVITRTQLDEALKCQVVFGIKLGSSLVELGFIDDERLTRLLSSKLGIPSVTRKELADIHYSIYSMITATMAEKFRAVPFRQEGKRLSVAMTDPTDLAAVDQLGFATGCIIHPFIAPDLCITNALGKYYHVRDTRYSRAAGGMRTAMMAMEAAVPPTQWVQDQEPQQPEAISVTYQKEDGELLNIQIPTEFEGFANMEGFGNEDIIMPHEEKLVRYTVDRLSTEFANAHSRDDVANVFITYLGQEFETGALFIVRGNSAVGWRAIRQGEKIAGFDCVNLLLSKPSVVRDVVDTMNFAMGTLVNTPENALILRALALRPEKPLLVLPVIMLKKVVAVVIVSADMDSLGRRLTELQKLVRKASLAFEMLIIKNKILMT